MKRLGLLHGCRLTPAAFVQAGMRPCEPCIKAKPHGASHTTAAEKPNVLLHPLFDDIKSLLVASIGGCKNVVTVTNEALGNCAVGPIKSKSDAAAFVSSFIIFQETQVQAPGFHRVQSVECDNRTEFMGERLKYMQPRVYKGNLGLLTHQSSLEVLKGLLVHAKNKDTTRM